MEVFIGSCKDNQSGGSGLKEGRLEISLRKHPGDHYMQRRDVVPEFPSIREETCHGGRKFSPSAGLGGFARATKKSERHEIDRSRSATALADLNPLGETGNVVEAICKLILMSRLQTPPGVSLFFVFFLAVGRFRPGRGRDPLPPRASSSRLEIFRVRPSFRPVTVTRGRFSIINHIPGAFLVTLRFRRGSR